LARDKKVIPYKAVTSSNRLTSSISKSLFYPIRSIQSLQIRHDSFNPCWIMPNL